jgi:hypothetical protein
MSDKIDLKKMEQKANKLLSQDGLTELLLGAIFFVSSASMSGRGSFIPFLPLYIIFMKKIVESFRKRFTYPRIGYVKIPDEESEDVGRGILTFVGVVMVVFVLGIYFGSGGDLFNSLYKWLPFGIGVFLFGPFQYLYSKTGDKVNWLYIAVSILSGLVFSLLTFTEVKEGPQMFMLAISGFFVLAGLTRLYIFTSKNPVLEVPQDE